MGSLWRKSGQVELDTDGERAPAAVVYFYSGGTTTPLTVYQDAAETTPHANPVVANGIGRWPVIFIPFTTSYDEKVVTAGGNQISYYREIPNADPVEASEDSVDETQLLQTGDVIWCPVDETRTGFVRLNGRTIGSASSGATERANADCEDLFTYLWNKIANAQAAVSTGRGASAAADWAANKTIALLNGQSSVLRGLDDMGNTAAGLLASAPFTNGDATTPGSIAGLNTHTLTTAQIPGHTHTFSATTDSGGSHTHTYSATTSSDGAHTHTASVTDPGHTHNVGSYEEGVDTGFGLNRISNGTDFSTASVTTQSKTTGITVAISSNGAHTHTVSGTTESGGAHTHTLSGTTASTGGGTAHNIVSRSLLGTYYQKL